MAVFGNLFEDAKEFYIGDIVFDDAIDEVAVGNIHVGGKKKNARIYVYSSEGYYPHCHLKFDDNTVCCICLNSANYFSHGSKTKTLTSSEMDAFIKWCNKLINIDGKSITNWKHMVDTWNNGISNLQMMKIPELTTMPKYTYNMPSID